MRTTKRYRRYKRRQRSRTGNPRQLDLSKHPVLNVLLNSNTGLTEDMMLLIRSDPMGLFREGPIFLAGAMQNSVQLVESGYFSRSQIPDRIKVLQTKFQLHHILATELRHGVYCDLLFVGFKGAIAFNIGATVGQLTQLDVNVVGCWDLANWVQENIINAMVDPPEDCTKSPVYALTSDDGSLEITSIGRLGIPIERGNYTEENLAKFDRSVAAMSDPSPSGRLHVLEGPPGTGKSYIIRSMVDACPDRKFILMFGSMLAAISSPSLLNMLLSEMDSHHDTRLVLVVEDADRYVAPRMADNVDHVSTLLNASDGLIGEALDVHIVVSTNQKKTEIDKALTRKGRLCEHFQLLPLPTDMANKRVIELVKEIASDRDVDLPSKTPEEFTRPATLADIYYQALVVFDI